MNDRTRNARLFSLLTDVSDDLVEESMILPADHATKPHRFGGWFSEMMSSPVVAAVLSGIVSVVVLAAIIMAGHNGPTPPVAGPGDSTQSSEQPAPEDFWPFYIGMPFEDMMEAAGDSFLYRYANILFLPREDDRFLVIDTDNETIVDMAICESKTPTHSDFTKVQAGMTICQVSAILGIPEESYTSGWATLSYSSAEGDICVIYLDWKDGKTVVGMANWTNPDPVQVIVDSPELLGDSIFIRDDPDIAQMFHDYFDHVYTTHLFESIPNDPTLDTAAVTITYEDGSTREYQLRGSFLSGNGGETWEKILENQPTVTVSWQDLIRSLTMVPIETNVYILWADESGFWGYFADLDAQVYIKAPHEYQVFDTVWIRYYPFQLKMEDGVLGADRDPVQKFYYDYVLENPLSIRPSGQQMRG